VRILVSSQDQQAFGAALYWLCSPYLFDIERLRARTIESQQGFHPIFDVDQVVFGRKEEDVEGIEALVNGLRNYNEIGIKQQ
jgi:hypothetical protein